MMDKQGDVPDNQAEEIENEEADEVAPLTRDEIQAIRALLRDAATVLTSCPIAIRAMSKR